MWTTLIFWSHYICKLNVLQYNSNMMKMLSLASKRRYDTVFCADRCLSRKDRSADRCLSRKDRSAEPLQTLLQTGLILANLGAPIMSRDRRMPTGCLVHSNYYMFIWFTVKTPCGLTSRKQSPRLALHSGWSLTGGSTVFNLLAPIRCWTYVGSFIVWPWNDYALTHTHTQIYMIHRYSGAYKLLRALYFITFVC